MAVAGTGASRGAGGQYQVRAIFDDAAFAVPGEDVRIAGAPVGSIQSLDVCTRSCPPSSPYKKAAVTLAINTSGFTPFYANATCSIRPQSLIGEKYVDCDPGTSSAPELQRIARGPGAGSYLLPVTRTHSPVDSDIVQDIYREPTRQAFGIIIAELGTGLAARGSDLNTVIHRANPALGYTDQVFKILASQNRQLAQLATDSNAVLAPLASEKRQLADFIVQARVTSDASAARAADIARTFALFPTFLRRLQPLMADLGALADQGTPLFAELGRSASGLGRAFQNLAPFATVARPALIELGAAAAKSQPALVSTQPLADRLRALGTEAVPAAESLQKLLVSFNKTGGIERLMDLLFYGATTSNGFDKLGHYARLELLVNPCTGYVTTPTPGCSANFAGAQVASAASAPAGPPTAPATAPATAAAAAGPATFTGGATRAATLAAANATQAPAGAQTLKGLLSYLIGGHS